MDFNEALEAIMINEIEIALPKVTTPDDKLKLQNSIKLKNQLLAKQRKKLQYDPTTNKAKVVPITANDSKIDQALAKVK
jgi:hypothetical protein